MGMREDIIKAAERVYETLGPGHEEVIYREAMSVELQERGYLVKTEMPVSVAYETSGGKRIIVGNAKVDLYVEKAGERAILELKTVSPLIKEKKSKEKEEIKEYRQLMKYLESLQEKNGYLINFPFPPKDKPEIISAEEKNE